MSHLTSSIETFVPDFKAVLVRAKVLGSRFKPVDGGGSETGAVTLKVLELYRGNAPEVGATFEIEGKRRADAERRILDTTNAWNALNFAMNDEMLLALHAGPNPKVFIALAATSAGPLHGADLKEAVVIEALPAPQRLARVRLALQSESDLLQNYALSQLRVPGVATREQGGLALAQAFAATHVSSVRSGLFAEMETPPWVDLSLGPDAANRAILSVWLAAILEESNADRRSSLLNHFAAKLGSTLTPNTLTDRELRAKVAAAIVDPPKAQVAAMLQAAAAAHPAEVRFKRLVEAWSH